MLLYFESASVRLSYGRWISTIKLSTPCDNPKNLSSNLSTQKLHEECVSFAGTLLGTYFEGVAYDR